MEERDASQIMNIYALHKVCINLVMRNSRQAIST